MKIQNIAKAILLPALMLPVIGSKATAQETKDRVVSKENLLFPVIDSITASTLALSRSIDPLSLSFLALSKKFDDKYYITKILRDPEHFWDYEKLDTYYKVETKNNEVFYIARFRNARTEHDYAIAEQEELKKRFIFPKAIDEDTPVAKVFAKEAGLDGVFEIYERNGGYQVKYDYNPLLYIPEHTTVSATYLVNLENALGKLPPQFTKALAKEGIYLMVGADYNDVYYSYYPSWKNQDTWKSDDPIKPAYEITENGYIDRRKYMHIGGTFIDRKAIMPQQYVNYYTNKTFDYTNNKEEIMRVMFHELGHALDYAYFSAFSDIDELKAAHKLDIKTFSDDDKKNLVYFYNSRSETFAEVTAALLGGFNKERAAIMLHKFPKCAEFIRDDVLPRIDVNISIEQIRKDIYPGYLRKNDEKTKKAVQKLSGILTIPDRLQEYRT